MSSYAAYYNADGVKIDTKERIVEVSFLRRIETHDVSFADSALWDLGVRFDFKLVISGPEISDDALDEMEKLCKRDEPAKFKPPRISDERKTKTWRNYLRELRKE